MSETGWQIALKALKDSNVKIRRKAWECDFCYIFFNGRNWENESGHISSPELYSEFYYEDWQEYTEPKKERKTRVEKRYAEVNNSHDSELIRFLYSEPQTEWKAYAEIDVHVFEEGKNEQG